MTVVPGSPSNPSRIATMRAMFMPCSPPGRPQPSMRSSSSAGSSAGTASRAARTIAAARSSGRNSMREPLWARPIGDRTAATMTASGISVSRFILTKAAWAGDNSEQARRRNAVGIDENIRQPPWSTLIHRQGRPLQRDTGRRETYAETHRAIAGPGIGSGRSSAYSTTGEHRTGARPADRLLIIGHPNRQTSTPPHQSPTESLAAVLGAPERPV